MHINVPAATLMLYSLIQKLTPSPLIPEMESSIFEFEHIHCCK